MLKKKDKEGKDISDENFDECKHEHTGIRTIATYATCEVTAIFCADCGKQLTEEEWNC